MQHGKSALHFAVAAWNQDDDDIPQDDDGELHRRVLSICELLINHNADANSTTNVSVSLIESDL